MHTKYIKLLMKKVPVTNLLCNYSKKSAATDLLAGITVGLMLIPQSIAYASLAGLSPQYGMYSAIAGGLVYAIFGTVKEVSIGPTALLALLTYQYADEIPAVAALLSFITGSICVLFGLFNLGFIINYISTPVISGYTSAAAVVIAISQVKGILGLTFSSKNFLTTAIQLVKNIYATKFNDMILGISCLAVLILLKEIPKLVKIKQLHFLFYISIGKNLIVVLACSSLSYTFDRLGKTPFTLTGNITDELPSITLPDFSLLYNRYEYSFIDVLQKMSFGITTIILIAIISEIVVAKAFVKSDRMDASQELIALGSSNILGSFLGSMPVTGSFSRSAVNSSCDVKSSLAGIYAALLVVIALLFLTPYFYYIPRAALSAIIVNAMIYMIDLNVILQIWKSSRKDIIPAVGTFVSSLIFGIEFGLICGLLIDLSFLLLHNAIPNISVDKFCENQLLYIVYTPKNSLFYSSANYLQEKIISEMLSIESKTNVKIILNMQHVFHIDYTALQTLINVIRDLKLKNTEVVIVNVNEDIKHKLADLTEYIQYNNLYDLLKVKTENFKRNEEHGL